MRDSIESMSGSVIELKYDCHRQSYYFKFAARSTTLAGGARPRRIEIGSNHYKPVSIAVHSHEDCVLQSMDSPTG